MKIQKYCAQFIFKNFILSVTHISYEQGMWKISPHAKKNSICEACTYLRLHMWNFFLVCQEFSHIPCIVRNICNRL
ncbi:unnamed protein product [Blepharisma stoltei]|uniref:Uncharacterized protein n=1 Tax=Blepharisma stoltei TaxID=1481888 RepID=A0AAU9IFJ3_9CILI|nr:unnamed protein product [Blepharisma stoltei]